MKEIIFQGVLAHLRRWEVEGDLPQGVLAHLRRWKSAHDGSHHSIGHTAGASKQVMSQHRSAAQALAVSRSLGLASDCPRKPHVFASKDGGSARARVPARRLHASGPILSVLRHPTVRVITREVCDNYRTLEAGDGCASVPIFFYKITVPSICTYRSRDRATVVQVVRPGEVATSSY